ncbi:MAG: ABC transporter substrate-binding protein, partial [Thermoleophilia bacterium]|nr:ABC transporter substrate-binding protein [Thermoleophilia bacterium]
MERHRSTRGESRGRPRATVLALVAALSAALVLAVNASGAPSQTVTLKLLAQSTGAGGNVQMQAVIEKFQQRYPNIKVDATFLPIGTAYAQALRTQLQAGNAPDVFYVTAGSGGLQSVLPLAREGYVADLSRRPWAKDHVPENARHL